MIIGIDARSLEEPEPTGVSRYLGNLLRQFVAVAPENKYVLFFKSGIPSHDYLATPAIEARHVRMGLAPKKKVIWEQLFLPRALSGVDVLFSPSYLTPRSATVPAVVAIHDITFELNPQWFSPLERLKMRTLTKSAAEKAAQVIAVSNATKEDICRYYKIAAEKVRVIHGAADPFFFESAKMSEKDEDECRQKFGLQGSFVLYVGSIFSRRNVPALLDAFKDLVWEGRDLMLMLVGEDRTYPPQDIKGKIAGSGIEDRIVWIDHIRETDLARLYNSAEVFVYPSSYEGFGLPVVEAMACGTPVVTGNNSSLREIAHDAAILVDDPRQSQQIFEALVSVLDDPRKSEDLSNKGRLRASTFSWETAARETLRVLAQAKGNR